MSILFKEGINYKNERVWRSEEPYYLCFAQGDWAPSTAAASLIYSTESNYVRQRLEVDDISVGWNLNSNIDEVLVTKTFSPTEELKFNRLFVKVGGPQRAKFEVEFGQFNTLRVLSGLDDYGLLSRISYNGYLYDVSANDFSEGAMSLVPVNNAPYLPSSGRQIINDASGNLLIGTILDNNYYLAKDEEAFIKLIGYTKT